MTVLTVFLVVLGALLAACVVVLYRRRGSTGSMDPHVRSAAERDAAARSASARASDRQGMGPGF
jgi:hypothetical protein